MSQRFLMAQVVAIFVVATAISPAVALTPTTYIGTTSGTTLGGLSYGLWTNNWSNGYSGNNANYAGTIYSVPSQYSGRVYFDVSDFFVNTTDGKIGALTLTTGTLQNVMATSNSGKTTRIGSGFSAVGTSGTFAQSGGTFFMNSCFKVFCFHFISIVIPRKTNAMKSHKQKRQGIE
jgi:hypothetical protein